MTEYIVLKQMGEASEAHWKVVPGTTVREAADKGGDGQYVQVPARSFKPVTAKKKQTTRIEIS